MNDRGEMGKKAEDLALSYLLDNGLKLLHRNWRCSHKELDLVMEGIGRDSGLVLHIVEVRSLMEPCVCMPFETVGFKKQQMIMRAAQRYVGMVKAEYEVQFDIVSVTFTTNGIFKLEYFPDAFTPVW